MFLHILLFTVLYVITAHFLHKIRQLPPYPFSILPIIGHLNLLNKPLHRCLSKISNYYGPIFFLHLGSRRVLVVSSPVTVEDCLSKNNIVFAYCSQILAGKHLVYNYTSLLWAPYGDHWRNLRCIFSIHIFCANRLQLLTNIHRDEVHLLLRKLFKNQGQTIEMKPMFFEVTMNVMMRIIAGKRYYGDSMVEVEEAMGFKKMVVESFRTGGATNVGDFLPAFKWISNNEKKLIELQKERDKSVQELVDECRKKMEESKNLTLIEALLSLQKTEPEHHKDEDIKSMILVLLLAGTDTSAGTMEWAVSPLLNNSEVLKKAQAEIDDVVGKNCLVEESDLSRLSYLHCVINETLRMYPASPLLFAHESSKDCVVGGFRIPCGTTLLVNLWAIHYDPKIWKEPKKFKPERFQGLEGNKDGFKFMPFGSGRRGCPGEGLATHVVGLTLVSLIQCFEWERVGEEMVDMAEGTGLTMTKTHPLQARCRPCQAMVELLSQT
ncbi:hypothetical protein SLEP1_g16666 [Rubroshorea leprosula]|uniref:Cytochrome P450 n=1 Tax=Rubroshorea leprosula TaxID=152421 RepID=A0AAV5IXF6_9ROSI|nr:hypothetical protein SLEP1_g16666 [Rubroshorea leprosula]